MTTSTEGGYPVSRDYALLWRMAKDSRVVCFVDYRSREPSRLPTLRDVAHTLNPHDDVMQISVRGVCYVWAEGQDDFVAQCRKYDVAFIPPEPIP